MKMNTHKKTRTKQKQTKTLLDQSKESEKKNV